MAGTELQGGCLGYSRKSGAGRGRLGDRPVEQHGTECSYGYLGVGVNRGPLGWEQKGVKLPVCKLFTDNQTFFFKL